MFSPRSRHAIIDDKQKLQQSITNLQRNQFTATKHRESESIHRTGLNEYTRKGRKKKEHKENTIQIPFVHYTEDKALREIKKAISTERLELRTTEVNKKLKEIKLTNLNLRPIDITNNIY